MNYCECPLCREYQEKENILFETQNFFVVPSLGQLVEGYLLICSKKHYISISSFEKELAKELEEVKEKTKEVLSKQYELPLFFEHGPADSVKRGGCCVEHAHLHAVPVNIDILNDIKKYFPKIKKISSFSDLKKGKPYLFYEDQVGNKYFIDIPEVIPSQFFRKLIGEKINIGDKWDWRTYPKEEEFKKTLVVLGGKFK